jgi:hypothetical protein
MVGPSMVGSLPCPTAWKVTGQLPLGRAAEPAYRPFDATPETSDSGMTTLPATAVTLVGALP